MTGDGGIVSPFRLVEERVRPVRASNKQPNYRENWWLHVTQAPEAAAYLRRHGRLLALAQLSKHLGAAFVRDPGFWPQQGPLEGAEEVGQRP